MLINSSNSKFNYGVIFTYTLRHNRRPTTVYLDYCRLILWPWCSCPQRQKALDTGDYFEGSFSVASPLQGLYSMASLMMMSSQLSRQYLKVERFVAIDVMKYFQQLPLLLLGASEIADRPDANAEMVL